MYTVDWEVLADDGHTTAGSFFFSLGDEPLDRDAVLEAYEDDDEVDDEVPPLETAAKGLLLVALVGLVGGPTAGALAVYPVADRLNSSTHVVDQRLKRLLAGAASCCSRRCSHSATYRLVRSARRRSRCSSSSSRCHLDRRGPCSL